MFGDTAGDTRFTQSVIMGGTPKYVKWTLPDDHSIQAFNKARREILVSKWLRLNIFTINPFVHKAPFLEPLNTSENLNVFRA